MSSGDTAEYILVQELHTDEARYAGLVLCVNVTNTKAVRQSVLSGDLPCCLLDASMVVSSYHVLVAINRAVNNLLRNQMITKNVYTEIIYSLSPSTNISESLRTFGAQDSSDAVLVVFVNNLGNFTEEIKSLKSLLNGEFLSLNELSKIANTERLKKIYQVSKDESQISNLENSLLTAMAIKHLTN